MNIYVTIPYTSAGLKSLLSFFMTKPVSLLNLVNEICSVRRIVPWIGFHQQKMLYLSTCIQHTIFQAGIYGQQALKQNQ